MRDDYHQNGYAHLDALIPQEVAQEFLLTLRRDIGPGAIKLSNVEKFPNLLSRPAFEIYGHHYSPMIFFLWGLTPMISTLVGRDLLPTYSYFRIYREGDVCRVHSDREACEHSLSLTLDYSDGVPWELQVATTPLPSPSAKVDPDFGKDPHSSIGMKVGDAVLYKGVHHRHGRVTPNPNGWSAHLFMHWVDRQGPYRDHAFDGQRLPGNVNFNFT